MMKRSRRWVIGVAVLTAAALLTPALPARAIGRGELEARIAKLRTSLDALATSLSHAEHELHDAETAVEKHSRALATAGERLETLQGAHARRTAEMYIVGGTGLLETLSTAETIDVFAERLGYLEELRSSEQGSLESLIALRRRAKTESAELARARESARAALSALSTKRRDLDAKLREYQALLNLSTFASGRVPTRATRGRLSGFACPVRGPHGLSNDFGDPRRGGSHKGIDMPASHGTPLVAVLPGRITSVVRGGWMGRGVILRDGSGNEWWYAHLSSTYVSTGERVTTGQVLGRVGCTGNCTGPHLHFEYHPGGGEARNPYKILRAAC